MKRVVDARGHKCPKPLMMVKEALNEMQKGDEATVILGSANARNNVEKLLTDHAIKFSTKVLTDSFEITLIKDDNQEELKDAQKYCSDSNCKK